MERAWVEAPAEEASQAEKVEVESRAVAVVEHWAAARVEESQAVVDVFLAQLTRNGRSKSGRTGPER